MGLTIRLKRMGTKNTPNFRIVAVDRRAARDGRCLVNLGYYNPVGNPHTVVLEEEATMKHLQNGAQPTDAVVPLLREKGIIRTNTGTWVKKS